MGPKIGILINCCHQSSVNSLCRKEFSGEASTRRQCQDMAPEKKFTNISEEFLGNFSAKLSLNAHFNCSNCHFSLFYCISSEWDGGLILVAVEKDEGQDGVMPYFCPQGVLCHENHATQRNREPNKVYFIFFINWLFLYYCCSVKTSQRYPAPASTDPTPPHSFSFHSVHTRVLQLSLLITTLQCIVAQHHRCNSRNAPY